MTYSLRPISLFIISLVLVLPSLAQQITPEYKASDISQSQVDSLRLIYGNNKKLPKGYEWHALMALSHYPELQDVKIRFKTKKRGAPFVSRPTVWSTFFKSKLKRNYLVIIRDSPHAMLDSILLHNMPLNAQIGVLGHELGHTADYVNRGFGKMLNVVFGNLSWKFLDKFEFATDQRAIEHGLGFQILAWSEHAIKTLRVNEPAEVKGSSKLEGFMQRERYMRPNTIKKVMLEMPLYDKYLSGQGFGEISDN